MSLRLWEELEREAAEQDMSTALYCRLVLRNRLAAEPTAEPESESNTELRERVDELEDELDAVKPQYGGQLDELAIQLAAMNEKFETVIDQRD